MVVLKRKAWSSRAAARLMATMAVDSVEDAVVRLCATLRTPTDGPTDLEAVAARLGVHAIRGEILPVSGELRMTDGEMIVAYDTGLDHGRRRFTIAHELGHAFFESTGPGCPRHGLELERICDLFAVELLMPANLMAKHMVANSPGEVLNVASVFGVSIHSAMRRFSEITGLPAAYDDGTSRTATMDALASPDPQLDQLIEQARAREQADCVVHLPHNSKWNGPWMLRACASGRSRLVVLTAEPIVDERLRDVNRFPDDVRDKSLTAIRQLRATLSRSSRVGDV